MMSHSRRQIGLFAGAVAAVAATVTLSGCAAVASSAPAALEGRIEAAVSPQDHETIALEYERQAGADAALAKRHMDVARIYRRNTSPRGGPEAHEPLARHCEELARTYQKAADENVAMARLHRDLARQAKRQ